MKIIVGASTYGPLPRVNMWIKTLWSNMEEMKDHDVHVMVCDDGTQDSKVVRDRANFCRSWNVRFLHNEKNLGIPATWNRLCQSVPDADLAIIHNDDIRCLIPGWLTRVTHFFEHNENIGTVGFPLVNQPAFVDMDARWWDQPGRVGCAVGAAFAVRPSDVFSVKNVDGSSGYWEDLLAFHEELEMGFCLAQQGKLSVMLPWPPFYHQGGATFAANEELIWRDPSPYLPMDEFLKYNRMMPFYVETYEERYKGGKVDRMSYSRIMFAKKWGILKEVEEGRRIQKIKDEDAVDVLAEPQKFVHARVVDSNPPRKIVWMDRDGKEQVREDF